MAAIPVLAGTGDAAPLSDVLQAAFWDDPVMVWLLPDEATRSRKAAALFRVLLEAHYIGMRTVWTTEAVEGAALWAPPKHWRIEPGEIIRHAPTFLSVLGWRVARSLRFLEGVDKHHPKEPHWYLGVLGTNPPSQGHGVGSALLAPVLERCDREGVPAYLESSKESNIPFYERHGFRVTGEIKVMPSTPLLWPMWREPQPD